MDVEVRAEQVLNIVLQTVETLSVQEPTRRLALKIFLNRIVRRRTTRRIVVGNGNDTLDAGQTEKVVIDEGSAGGNETDVVTHDGRL